MIQLVTQIQERITMSQSSFKINESLLHFTLKKQCPKSKRFTPPSNQLKQQEAAPKPAQEFQGIRIRGMPKSKEQEARLRQKHDIAAVQKLTVHMEIKAVIDDVTQNG